MRLLRTNRLIRILIYIILSSILVVSAAVCGQQQKFLIVYDLETEECYRRVEVTAGDEVEFNWIHSFEHIPWNEYYVIEEDGGFLLQTISVAGFGAGIPAEMDVSYRYEDGLVYMDGINSRFEQFNFINSNTALQNISVRGEHLISGADMPHHRKIVIKVVETYKYLPIKTERGGLL